MNLIVINVTCFIFNTGATYIALVIFSKCFAIFFYVSIFYVSILEYQLCEVHRHVSRNLYLELHKVI